MSISKDELKVALEALDAEAEKWRKMSESMSTVNGAVTRLTLEPAAFFAGHDFSSPAGLHPRYVELHQRMVKLSSQATTEFQDLRGALIRARNSYERSDGAAEKNMKAIYGS